MSVKIKVSYSTPEEWKAVAKRLAPIVADFKFGKPTANGYERVYLDIDLTKPNTCNNGTEVVQSK